MNIESLIREFAHAELSASPLGTESTGDTPSAPLTPPLTAQWRQRRRLPTQLAHETQRTEQFRCIADDMCLLPQDGNALVTDEIENLRAVLKRLRALVRRKHMSSAQAHGLNPLFMVLDEGKAALEEALYKRAQFMVATQDYTKLPQKMVDEVINYLARRAVG